MSTSVLKALPGKLDIKRHSPSILYVRSKALLLLLLIHCLLLLFCVCSLFCYAILFVLSIFAISLIGCFTLIVYLAFCDCYYSVALPYGAVDFVGLLCVVVVFPYHTRLLFCGRCVTSHKLNVIIKTIVIMMNKSVVT